MNKYENQYAQKDYDDKVQLVKDLNAFDSGYKFEFIEDLTNDGREYIALTGLIPVVVSRNTYSKIYNFYLGYDNLPYVRFDTYKSVAQTFKAPQNVGVLTAKKIKAWVDYLTSIYEQLVLISRDRVKIIQDFEDSVRAQGAKMGRKDEHYGTFEGSIVKNGITFNFQVHDEGYISKDISIHYSVADTLDNFLSLSDNKYIPVSD